MPSRMLHREPGGEKSPSGDFPFKKPSFRTSDPLPLLAPTMRRGRERPALREAAEGMSGMMGWGEEDDRGNDNDGRIYVGNLPADVREKDLEDLFYKYGRIRDIELKNRRGLAPFAFVRFEDPRDAEDAIYGRNGYDYGQCRLRVELPRNPGGGGPRGRSGPPSRRSEFRVLVSGLPPSGSWQDLKDHMREAGGVCYADVQKDGMGVVEFLRKEDMEYALRRLDDSKFRSHEGETSYIRVYPERSTSYGYSRSRSGSRGRDSPYQSRGSPYYTSSFAPY